MMKNRDVFAKDPSTNKILNDGWQRYGRTAWAAGVLEYWRESSISQNPNSSGLR